MCVITAKIAALIGISILFSLIQFLFKQSQRFFKIIFIVLEIRKEEIGFSAHLFARLLERIVHIFIEIYRISVMPVARPMGRLGLEVNLVVMLGWRRRFHFCLLVVQHHHVYLFFVLVYLGQNLVFIQS